MVHLIQWVSDISDVHVSSNTSFVVKAVFLIFFSALNIIEATTLDIIS